MVGPGRTGMPQTGLPRTNSPVSSAPVGAPVALTFSIPRCLTTPPPALAARAAPIPPCSRPLAPTGTVDFLTRFPISCPGFDPIRFSCGAGRLFITSKLASAPARKMPLGRPCAQRAP